MNSRGHIWWCAILLYGGIATILGLGAWTVVENKDQPPDQQQVESKN